MNQTRRQTLWVFFFATTAALGLAGAVRAADAPKADATPPVAGLKIGDKAPAFELKTLEKGERRTLPSVSKGKLGAVVFFHATRCPFVKEARPLLNDLSKTYGAKVTFVGINSNQTEPADEVKKDAADNFPGMLIVKDEGSKVADLFAAEHTPEVFLVDAKGVVRYHGSYKELGAALADFTAGKPIAKPEAKAFGCSIKRKP